jgi:hypothetical protein
MLDVVYIACTLVFFLTCFGLISFFDKLSRGDL